MKVGDIVWVRLPAGAGHEQAGRRPAVILQEDRFAAASPLILVAPLTTAPVTLRFPATLAIEPTPTNGLRQSSVILVFQLRAVDRRLIEGRIGVVESELLAEIFEALDKLTGRNS